MAKKKKQRESKRVKKKEKKTEKKKEKRANKKGSQSARAPPTKLTAHVYDRPPTLARCTLASHIFFPAISSCERKMSNPALLKLLRGDALLTCCERCCCWWYWWWERYWWRCPGAICRERPKSPSRSTPPAPPTPAPRVTRGSRDLRPATSLRLSSASPSSAPASPAPGTQATTRRPTAWPSPAGSPRAA